MTRTETEPKPKYSVFHVHLALFSHFHIKIFVLSPSSFSSISHSSSSEAGANSLYIKILFPNHKMWQTHDDCKGLSEGIPKKIHWFFYGIPACCFLKASVITAVLKGQTRVLYPFSILKLRHIQFDHKSKYTLNNSFLTAGVYSLFICTLLLND